MASVEHSNVNYVELLPVYWLTDYNIESEFISTKRKIVNLINKEKFENFLKENKYEQILIQVVWHHANISTKKNSSRRTEQAMSVWIFSHSISEAYLSMVVNYYSSWKI